MRNNGENDGESDGWCVRTKKDKTKVEREDSKRGEVNFSVEIFKEEDYRKIKEYVRG